jgi:hypothetical protein
MPTNPHERDDAIVEAWRQIAEDAEQILNAATVCAKAQDLGCDDVMGKAAQDAFQLGHSALGTMQKAGICHDAAIIMCDQAVKMAADVRIGFSAHGFKKSIRKCAGIIRRRLAKAQAARCKALAAEPIAHRQV